MPVQIGRREDGTQARIAVTVSSPGLACDLTWLMARRVDVGSRAVATSIHTMRGLRGICANRAVALRVRQLADPPEREVETMVDPELCWVLLYTKPHAESWAEINLRRQGYATLLPRVRARNAFAPLFTRYLFAAHSADQRLEPIRSTRGVLSIVQFGDRVARVPVAVIEEVRARMDAYGVVTVEAPATPDPLFARAERERVRALVKFAKAGFRVVA